jgi:hypothetical protein
VVEAVLGHVGHQGGTAGRYNRALYRAEKADAPKRWARMVSDVVEGSEHKVVRLRRARDGRRGWRKEESGFGAQRLKARSAHDKN